MVRASAGRASGLVGGSGSRRRAPRSDIVAVALVVVAITSNFLTLTRAAAMLRTAAAVAHRGRGGEGLWPAGGAPCYRVSPVKLIWQQIPRRPRLAQPLLAIADRDWRHVLPDHRSRPEAGGRCCRTPAPSWHRSCLVSRATARPDRFPDRPSVFCPSVLRAHAFT